MDRSAAPTPPKGGEGMLLALLCWGYLFFAVDLASAGPRRLAA